MWAGVLHAGPGSAVGGLTALERRGLKNWHRDEITVLLPKSHNLASLPGVSFVETRRPVGLYATGAPPTWRVEPAALLFAGYVASSRTAHGLVSAVVQQRLTDPDASVRSRSSACSRCAVPSGSRRPSSSLADGSHSLAEQRVVRLCVDHGLPIPDRQTRRVDASGRLRYTDAEWLLPSGKVVVLEVDGGFHMEVEHWEDDITRERDLVATGAIVLRCTDRELIDEPGRVLASLRAVGVGESSA